MGVMLDPAANPHPTEEEIARAAGLVPGSAEEAKFLAMRAELALGLAYAWKKGALEWE